MGITLGIDATNLRQGGGRTHIIEVLRVANPNAHGVCRVVVWGSKATLDLLEDQLWLNKCNPPLQERGLLLRTLWQLFFLSRAARSEACDVLWVPGGSFAGNFYPVVTMSRNLLPFEWKEIRRYGFSWIALKLLLIRLAQVRTFRSVQAIIFLTDYASTVVQRVTGCLKIPNVVIAHGVSQRFCYAPRTQIGISSYTALRPYRILYVSIIDQYKHPWHVVEAVAQVRQRTGWPLVLDLVGPAYSPSLTRLRRVMSMWDSPGEWVTWYGNVSNLAPFYINADLGVFASSCENMPNILLETMAAGLPIACSNRGPMPEILGDAGIYFNPEIPLEIAEAIEKIISDPNLRMKLSKLSFAKSKTYNWDRCAVETFEFITNVHRQRTSKILSCVV